MTDQRAILSLDGLAGLIAALRRRGFRVVGPVRGDGAIVYGDIERLDDLPRGWTDRQEAGRYRLERRSDAALFGYAVGPQSWKRFLHPPLLRLNRTRADGGIEPIADAAERYAFLGVRACELKAIAIQDRVLMGGARVEPHYAARRADAFIVAVNCGEAGGTCFCVSMQAGPRVGPGHDLALTELLDGERHEFLVEIGSPAGAEVLAEIASRPAADADVAAAAAVVARTAESMGRAMPAEARATLMANLEHPRWDEVAQRCLSCGNCTSVCPTCFCTTVESASDLVERTEERQRRWDSCFTLDFTHLHGGSVRPTTRSRYRQWLTHKLATWVDQFGTSGCVGCGRCVTWCPVGIDITEEVRALAEGGSP